MKNNFVVTLLILSCFQLQARKTTVTTATSINNGSWEAGDTIVMKNGLWNNQTISFKGTGTEAHPVVLLAETPGSVILNGTSRLSFSGSYIVVSGLYFKDGTLSGASIVEFRTSSSEFATYSTLKNSAIVNYNPSLNTVDSKWVSLYGINNTIDHCSFENKNNSGTLLVVWLQSGVTVNHVISNNYFGYRNSNLDVDGNELNGQEIIRVGDSSTSMTTANVTVTGNYFEKCNGEIEVISNKSCGNLYSNNLFTECKGMLTLRHGNDCTVAGNYFFGNGVSESGGVRIIGENHKVYNNYFENLRGSGYRAAICMVRGKENSLLNEYFQVKNALVVFNTMVDCSQSFSINYNGSATLTLPPIGSVIAHNHVYNSSSSYNNITIDQNFVANMGLTWKNNLMNQGKYTDFSYSSTQVVTGKDAKMTLTGTTTNMYEPAANSALISYATNEYNEVLFDIRGRNRSASAKIPGASQITGTASKVMPEKKAVGVRFFNSATTHFDPTKVNTPFKYKLNDRQLSIETTENAKLFLYDLSGIIVLEANVSPQKSYATQLLKGIYILNFIANNGSRFSDKILVQ